MLLVALLASLTVPAQRAAGTVTEYQLPSVLYGKTRRVWTYLPPSYQRVCNDGCDLVIAFDGDEYRGDMRLPAVLDSLVAARRMAPAIALLIDNESSTTRLDDLANHDRFARFVTDELLPWARGRWHLTRDPARTIVTGSSAGGLAAAYLAFKRPDLFGLVLSQSGAFWRGNEGSNSAPYEWLTQQYATSARKPIRFLLEVGTTEDKGAMGGAAPSILAANRALRDVLRRKGYEVAYYEVPNGVHAVSTWKDRLPIGLAALAKPPARIGIGANSPSRISR